MIHRAYPVQMEISGRTALWNRPDTGASPVSYPAPTYSAVKGLFESVLWGPDVEIVPRRVELCSPVRYESYVTNYGGPLRNTSQVKDDTQYQLYATVLIDVTYRLFADVIPNANKANLPERALLWDRHTTSPGHAYQSIFNRRLKLGQSYASLSLGWREFTPSYFGPFRENTKVCTDMPDILIPSMLRQVFSGGYNSPVNAIYDTDLVIHEGILIYPQRRSSGDD